MIIMCTANWISIMSVWVSTWTCSKVNIQVVTCFKVIEIESYTSSSWSIEWIIASGVGVIISPRVRSNVYLKYHEISIINLIQSLFLKLTFCPWLVSLWKPIPRQFLLLDPNRLCIIDSKFIDFFSWYSVKLPISPL